MPKCRDAKLLQVLLRQPWKNRLVNLVLAERSLVLSEAKAPQPDHDVHDGGLSLHSMHDRPNDKGCPAQALSVSGDGLTTRLWH